MNKFIWCVVVEGQIQYGMLKAVDGKAARDILNKRYEDRGVQAMEIKGVASETFEMDIVSMIYVRST